MYKKYFLFLLFAGVGLTQASETGTLLYVPLIYNNHAGNVIIRGLSRVLADQEVGEVVTNDEKDNLAQLNKQNIYSYAGLFISGLALIGSISCNSKYQNICRAISATSFGLAGANYAYTKGKISATQEQINKKTKEMVGLRRYIHEKNGVVFEVRDKK